MAGANGITSNGGSSKAISNRPAPREFASAKKLQRVAALHATRMKFGPNHPAGRKAHAAYRMATAGMSKSQVATARGMAEARTTSKRAAVNRIVAQRGGGPGMRQTVKDLGGRVR